MPKKKSGNHAQPAGNGRRTTLRDIAKKIGTSHTTVSLALRGSPQISAGMRDKVRQTASEMGYQSDPMLSALAQYRLSNQEKPVRSALAWINPLQDPGWLRKFKEFDLYWKGAKEAAFQMGFSLEEFSLNEIPLQRLNTIFKARNIRGILIAPLRVPGLPNLDIDWEIFPWTDYATTRFGRNPGGPQAHFVTSAQTANTMLSFGKAREKGYQRIGFVGGIRERRFFKAGYFMSQSEIPARQRLTPVEIPETWPHHKQLEMLKNWIAETGPDAVIVERPGIFKMLKELRIKVPGEIGLITCSIHDTPINAGIDQNPEEIGRAAVRLLASLLNKNEVGIPSIRNEVLIEGRWVDGSMLPDRT